MDKVFFALKYLRYRRSGTNEHGIHSPFVFDLYNRVFKNTADYYAYSPIEEIRKRLLNDNRVILVKDLGAGSTGNSGTARKLRDITKTAAKEPEYSQLLFRLVDYFQPATILELGTSVGISTMYMAAARSGSRVITIEGSPEIRKIALQNFESLQLKNIHSIEGNFDAELPKVLKEVNTADLVFFDGNHRKEATLRYFEQCLQKADNESVFIFDDIYWSKEMAAAWEIIKSNPRVQVSIDLFQMGIIFFRKEQVKQHFVLSY